MHRAVLFTIGLLVGLIIDATAISLAATRGSLLLALLLCVPMPMFIWALITMRFDTRRRRRRKWPHRGATRDDYDPWVGGGIGPRQ